MLHVSYNYKACLWLDVYCESTSLLICDYDYSKNFIAPKPLDRCYKYLVHTILFTSQMTEGHIHNL